MYFQLMYHRTNGEYHARLYNAAGKLLMWTHSSRSKQVIVDVCSQIKQAGIGMNTPIRDSVVYD